MVRVIICDWESDLNPYNLSSVNQTKIQNQNFKVLFLSKIRSEDYINCEIYFGNKPDINFLKKLKNLKWIHLGSSGLDKIPDTFIFKNKITLTNIGNINSYSLASFCIGEIFTSLKLGRFNNQNLSNLNRNDFNRYFETFMDFRDIKLGILGYGSTSKIIINLLRGLKYIQIKVLTNQEVKNTKNIKFFKKNKKKEFLNNITHLVNLLPLNPDNKNFINTKFLNLATKPFYYINVGRGETELSSSISKAIIKKKIIGATIDVHGTSDGIIPKTYKGLNVKLTPHIAGWSNSFWDENMKIINFNLKQFKNNTFFKMKNLKFIFGRECL